MAIYLYFTLSLFYAIGFPKKVGVNKKDENQKVYFRKK
jgi:hypothetical protein